MKIAILCVGKLKERYYADAVDEYVKRVRRYLPIEVIEVPDLPEPERESPAEIARVLDKEAANILVKIKPGDYVVALCVDGMRQSSEGFADEIERYKNNGVRRVVFVIGGSLGLSGNILGIAKGRLSLSGMTLPHQLARVVLAEQIYRAVKINAGERYHK